MPPTTQQLDQIFRDERTASTHMPVRVPSEAEFGEKGEDQVDFLPADAIERLARALIARHQNLFGHLNGLRVLCLWRRQGGKKAGKAVFGKCEKPSGLTRYLSGGEEGEPYDFIVTLSADHCRDAGYGTAELEALTFHELSHTTLEEKEDKEGNVTTKPALTGHDFEGFRAEVEHFGFWQPDLVQMSRAVQLRLPATAEVVSERVARREREDRMVGRVYAVEGDPLDGMSPEAAG